MGPRVSAALGTPGFSGELARRGLAPLRRGPVSTLQLNVGLRCNLACHHCHVESGPKRREAMDRSTAERVIELLAASPSVTVVDLTGGAPELNKNFRFLVARARALGRRVTDRCNLTILFEPGQEDTAEFLAAHEVEVVASLPCYTSERVDRQRGRGVFDASIAALRRLCELGYGQRGSPLRLDLVYNPVGFHLPPPQAELEARYRTELRDLFGIEFHSLLAITNMPIKRFARALEREGRFDAYMALLVNHFNPRAVAALMCRSLVSIGYDGTLYDCDFNQSLGIEIPGPRRTIWQVRTLATLVGRPIATGGHCFGCTAGSGSSCSGALT